MSEPKADHSPLPWRQVNRERPFESADVYSLAGVLVAMCGDPEGTHANEDAEYIVRAANAYPLAEEMARALSADTLRYLEHVRVHVMNETDLGCSDCYALAAEVFSIEVEQALTRVQAARDAGLLADQSNRRAEP